MYLKCQYHATVHRTNFVTRPTHGTYTCIPLSPTRSFPPSPCACTCDQDEMADLAPCVYDVYVAPLLDTTSLTKLALSAHHASSCVHGPNNYEATRVFIYFHPANVLVRTDTTGGFRRALGVCEWTETLDTRTLIVRAVVFANLYILYLSNTRVSDISPLATCVNLISLDLDSTPVSDISPLATCVKLTTLCLSNTPVSDVSPLASCVNLVRVYLANTLVTDTTPLAHLVERGLRIIQ